MREDLPSNDNPHEKARRKRADVPFGTGVAKILIRNALPNHRNGIIGASQAELASL